MAVVRTHDGKYRVNFYKRNLVNVTQYFTSRKAAYNFYYHIKNVRKKDAIEGFKSDYAVVICRVPTRRRQQYYLVKSKLDGQYSLMRGDFIKRKGKMLGAPVQLVKALESPIVFKRNGKFEPSITIGGTRYSLGKLSSSEEAQNVRINELKKYYFCNGENPKSHYKKVLERWKSNNEQH